MPLLDSCHVLTRSKRGCERPCSSKFPRDRHEVSGSVFPDDLPALGGRVCHLQPLLMRVCGQPRGHALIEGQKETKTGFFLNSCKGCTSQKPSKSLGNTAEMPMKSAFLSTYDLTTRPGL